MLLELELGSNKARGLHALTMIGVAFQEIPLRHAVIRKHQLVGTAVRFPMLANAIGHGRDISRMVVIRTHESKVG